MSTIYLPWVGKPGISPDPDDTPDQTETALAELKQLIVNSPWQQRTNIVIDQGLMRVAEERAKFVCNVPDISAVQTGHVFPGVVVDGKDGNRGPNLWLKDAGIDLPDWYPFQLNSNTVESFATGQRTAQEAIDAWLKSPGHELHLTGGNNFYKNQKRIGFGVWFVGNYDPTWVFLSCHEA